MGEDKPPKVILEVNGKPLIEYLLDTFKNLQIDNPYVVVGCRQDLVRAAIQQYPVNFVEQGEPKGTGHAVLATKDAVDPAFQVAYLCYGDAPFFSKETFLALSDALNNPDVACALVTTTKTEQSEKFGRISRNDHGELKDIIEFKDASETERAITEVNAGCYAARLPWLWSALEQVKPSAVTGEYYLTDIVHIAIADGKRVALVSAKTDEAHGVDTPGLYSFVQSAKVGENTNR